MFLNEREREVLVRTLRRSKRGLVNVWGSWGPSGLPRWKRWVNQLASYFGIPYTDPGNFTHTEVQYLSEGETEVIDGILFQLSPPPRCRNCGGSNLDADPAGYYRDAEDHRGAPLLCLSCRN